MAIAFGQFERIAEAITERTADLLSAQVAVRDTRGTVVASSEQHLVGMHLSDDDPALETSYLRLPIHLETGSGEIVVSQPSNGESISPRLAHVLIDLVINQLAVVDRLPNQNELKNKLIHDLLHGSNADDSAILREAQVLGMDLAQPRAVILIDAADYILAGDPFGKQERMEARTARRIQLIIGSVVDFFQLPNDTICAYIGDGEVAVLKASNKQSLADWVDSNDGFDAANPSWANLTALKRAGDALLCRLRRTTRADINVGIGRYHPGVKGLAGSYQDARVALSLGRRFHGQNQVHCLDSLGIAAFVGVSDEGTKVDLATYLLSPLDHEPELLKTLNAFFENHCSPSSTVERIAIHRNTLSYRLDKITSLTGLDPRHFDDAVQIRLALVLRTLRSAQNCADA